MGDRKDISLLVLDVDGTLTDGKIYMGQCGEMLKAFDCKDGYGIRHILPEMAIRPAIITGRSSDIVANRAKELGITLVVQGADDKLSALMDLISKESIDFASVAYMGDDINDLAAMRLCGIKACPADAAKAIKENADFVSSKNGGDGAVREFIEWLKAGLNCDE